MVEEAIPQGEDVHQSIIALSLSSSALGFAWYNELSNSILVDIIQLIDDELDDTFNMIKRDCKPTLFTLHPKIAVNKPLVDLIITKESIAERNEIISEEKYDFIVPKASTWRADAGLELICSKLLLRDSMKSIKSFDENYRMIASKIPIDNSLIQQALGSLLIYIQTNILSLEDEVIAIASLGEYQRKKYMRIDDNTIRFVNKPLSLFKDNKDIHNHIG